MTLTHLSLAIAGLGAVLIPLLIHLLWRRQRTPLPWAAMRFLLEAYRKRRSRLRLEQWLLLAVRCAIPPMLGLALAQPYLRQPDALVGGEGRTVFLLLDNGLASTALQPDNAPALTHHLKLARRIIDQLGSRDRLTVITAAYPSAALLNAPSRDHQAVLDRLAALESAMTRTDFPGAILALQAEIDKHTAADEPVFVFLLTDFRAGSVDLGRPLPPLSTDPAERAHLFALQPAAVRLPNVQITRLQPARNVLLPADARPARYVTIRLERHGGALPPADMPVTMTRQAGAPVASRSARWAAGQAQTEIRFDLQDIPGLTGDVRLHASIEGDALPADNHRYETLLLRPRVTIAFLDRRTFGSTPMPHELSSGQWIRRALDPSGAQPFDLVDLDPAAFDAAVLHRVDAAVASRPDLLAAEGWNALRRYVEHGGLLLITPPVNADSPAWVGLLHDLLRPPWRMFSTVTQFPQGLPRASEQPGTGLLAMIAGEIDDLAFPVEVRRAMQLEPRAPAAIPSLVLSDGSPILVHGPLNTLQPTPTDATPTPHRPHSPGIVVCLAVAPHPEWTNLPGRPLMVPLFQEIIRQGLSLVHGSTSLLAGDRLPAPADPAATTWLAPSGRTTTLPLSDAAGHVVTETGFHATVDAAGRRLSSLAVNVDPAAARTDIRTVASVRAWLHQSGPWCILAPDNLVDAARLASPPTSIAGPLLLLALIFVIIETLLARWTSRARHRGPARAAFGLPPSIIDRRAYGPGSGGRP